MSEPKPPSLPPQENPEKSPKEMLDFKLGDNEYGIEVKKSDFEYAKNIQNESGILGYERTKVSKDAIWGFHKDFYKKEYGIDFDTLNIHNQKDFFEYRRNLESSDKALYWKLEDSETKLDTDMLTALSNGEFPYGCYNHKMGGDDTYRSYGSKEKTKQLEQDFVSDNFFIQKIYDVDRISKNLENGHGKKDIFNISKHPLPQKSNITLFPNRNPELGKTGKKISIGELPEYSEQLKSGDVFWASISSGFNTTAGAFFYGTDINKVSFGFPYKLDSFQEEYLRKSLDVYNDALDEPWQFTIDGFIAAGYEVFHLTDEILGNTSIMLKDKDGNKTHWEEVPRDSAAPKTDGENSEIKYQPMGRTRKKNSGEVVTVTNDSYHTDGSREKKSIKDIVVMLCVDELMQNEHLLNEFQEGMKAHWDRNEGGFFDENHRKEGSEEGLKILSVIAKKLGLKVEDVFANENFLASAMRSLCLIVIPTSTKHLMDGRNDNIEREINLPVFINHDEIPQLAWGHFKYASFMNEQGLNFVKFKHSEKLPTKKVSE